MEVVLYVDNTLPIPLTRICDLLNTSCDQVKFIPGKQRIRTTKLSLSCPSSYEVLPAQLLKECAKYDLALMGTVVPYDNNFFFEFHDSKAFISFNGWNQFTDLPIANGFVYFIASILCDYAGIGKTHDKNAGCINDFWWDKTGIDLGMRAAFICPACKDKIGSLSENQQSLLSDVESLLDLVSNASRTGSDLLSVDFTAVAKDAEFFDAFICHNSEDKPTIRKVNQQLKIAGVSTWFDEDQLKGGDSWQMVLEEQIANVRAAVIFVGENGMGPWQDREMRGFLSEFVERNCTVIPVILPDSKSIPALPIFLKQFAWIDLRKDFDSGILRLVGSLQ